MTWSYCSHRRYSMSQQKNSILINEHALNREPVPFWINSLPNLTSFIVLTIVPNCFSFVCLFLWYVIYCTFELSSEILKGFWYTLNIRSRGKQFCFPASLDVSFDFVSGNIRTFGKTKLTGFLRDLALSVLLCFYRLLLQRTSTTTKEYASLR